MKGKIMSTNNAPVRTERKAMATRARADRPATDRLRHQAGTVAKDVQEICGIARDAAEEKLGEWRDNASDYDQRGRGTVHSAVSASRQFVGERPVKSILIAAGVGVIAAGGVLLGRFAMRRIRQQPVKSVLIAAGLGLLTGHLWTRR
jgi:ElaB/YqjD/DUF883 family membrane-anchored ribosome-binding protein